MLALVYPDECRVCGRPLKDLSRIPVCADCLQAPEPLEAEYLCVSCRAPFRTSHPLDDEGRCALCRRGVIGFDAAYSYGFYEGVLRELVHQFKYGRIPTLAEPLGALMMRAYPREQEFDCVVPVPMHWRRRWQRGFNQVRLLARVVSRRTGARLIQPVRRRRPGPPQAGLTSAGRRRNVAGAFQVRRPAEVSGKRILLVDDVLTTGATAAACAAELKRAGARHVTVLTVARTDRRLYVEPYPVTVSSFAMGAA